MFKSIDIEENFYIDLMENKSIGNYSNENKKEISQILKEYKKK